MIPQPTLETDRLILRPFDLSDAPEIQRLAGDRAVAATTENIPHPYEDGMAESWISGHAEALEKGTDVHFAVVLKSTDDLAGTISLMRIVKGHRAELGYWIGKPCWGNGYCTEASRAVMAFGFDRLGLNRVHARHAAKNPASGCVMKKLGMTHEGRLRRHVRKWGQVDDLVLYGILKREWRGPVPPAGV